MAKSLALNILAVSGMVLGDGTNSRLGRVMGQTRQGEMECGVLQGLKGCCCPAVPSSGTVPRGWGQQPHAGPIAPTSVTHPAGHSLSF